jgi:broad specificity phosphatase PhoE
MKARVLQAWKALLNEQMGCHLLVVTHGGPIRVILGDVLGMADAALNKIEVPHASLSRIRIPAGGWPPSLLFHRGV